MATPGSRATAHEENLKRQAKALELRLAGATYEAIAQAVGYKSKASAHKAVQDALAAQATDPGMADAVTLEVARLDAMLTGLWGKARRGDVAAIDRALKISERRTALHLLAAQAAADAPAKGTPLDELMARRAAKGAPAGRTPGRGERAAR